MTLATDQLDRRVVAHLRRTGDYPPTAAEIAEALSTPMSSIRASLKRLSDNDDVIRAGIAANGARTWKLNPEERA